MSDAPTYTEAELAEFDRITMLEGSRNQMDRINSRLLLRKFIAGHGKEKCDAMFSEIKKREAAAKKGRKS